MSKKKMKEDLGEKNPKIENPVGNELHKKKDDYEEKWLNVRLKFLSFLAKMLEFKQTHTKKLKHMTMPRMRRRRISKHLNAFFF